MPQRLGEAFRMERRDWAERAAAWGGEPGGADDPSVAADAESEGASSEPLLESGTEEEEGALAA